MDHDHLVGRQPLPGRRNVRSPPENQHTKILRLIIRFLIEGYGGATLHTGDFRAEPSFVASLYKNPYLKDYLVPQEDGSSEQNNPTKAKKTLEAIYLDTASMLSVSQLPTKVCL